MTRWILVVAGLLLATGVNAAEPTRLLVLGDSLSAAHGIEREAGWVARLEERLTNRRGAYAVINASIGGDTTRGGRSRLPDALVEHDPDIVIIELGGNDGLRGIPLSETRRNLATMIETARNSGARVLLVGVRLPTNYGDAFIQRFRAVYRDLADEYDIALVEKFLAGVAEKPELMQPDGIHPTAAAQQRLLENIWAELVGLLNGAAERRTQEPAETG